MSSIYSFPPLVAANPRVLILGSMPGKASLAAGRYYAHPRNAFWPIMAQLFGFSVNDDYAARTAILTRAGIAVWDVLQSCQREGSLDADIDPHSMIVNDFAAFFDQYPSIHQVFFNGRAAEQVFQKRVTPFIDVSALPFQRLPSTSPAHASLSFEQKLACWQVICR